jgi:hypothetical protein
MHHRSIPSAASVTMKLVNKETGKVIEIPKKAHLQEGVLRELSKNESLSTKELNDALSSTCCYTACKSLKEHGLIDSSLEKKYTRWDPVTGQWITHENYDAIVMKSQEARERLTKQFKAEGLTDEEIAEKLSDMTDPRSVPLPYWEWHLSEKWKVLQ